MAQITVHAEARKELGKGANRRLRAQGKLPAVVYGHGIESSAISLTIRDVDLILRSETGHNTIFELHFGKQSDNVIIKDYQLDPIKGTLVHADLQTVAMDKRMTFAVPVHIEGTPAGVIAGGVLDLVLREIELECLPADLPDNIVIDVTDLEIGDAVRVNILDIDSSKIDLVSDPELVILTVVPPHVEKEPEEIVLEDDEDIEEGEGTDETPQDKDEEEATKEEEE